MNRHSALYTGIVRHRRFAPRAHAFAYRVHLLYLDLAELDTVFAGRWLWSVEGSNIVSFRKGDYLACPSDRSLATVARDLVEERTGRRPSGPIRLLTHPRYFGFVFNPVSFFYCFSADGDRVETIIAEVHNTPWNERHSYVLPVVPNEGGDSGHRFRFRKAFHVSPFMAMDHDYDWRLADPGERLTVHMRNERDGRCEFDASMDLRRQALGGRTLARILAAHPFVTAKVFAAIYWQALRLWLKGVPLHTHPARLSR